MDFVSANMPLLFFIFIIVVGAVVLLARSVFTVHTQEGGIVERFGKFHRVATEGLNFKNPFIDRLVYVEDLAMQLMDVPVVTKTNDDSIVTISVRVQFYVLQDKVKEAYYLLDDPNKQINAHVQNVILAFVPSLTLDEVYQQETKITNQIKNSLDEVMSKFGYAIENALVMNVQPADQVVAAMNEINAARREKIATEARAEANFIQVTRNAQAEAEAQKQRGIGIANERKAIVDGLRDSINDLREAIGTEVNLEEVFALLMMTNYFDMMKEIGQTSNTILFPHSPNAMPELMAQLKAAVKMEQAGTPPVKSS